MLQDPHLKQHIYIVFGAFLVSYFIYITVNFFKATPVTITKSDFSIAANCKGSNPKCKENLTQTTTTTVPIPTPTLPPGVTPPPAAIYKGIWISGQEIQALPISGPAWTQLKSAADGALGTPAISDQDSNHDVKALAVALVYARTGTLSYRTKAADAIMSAVGTEAGGRTLALGRNLVSYVIAADLINLSDYDATKGEQFRTWLDKVRFTALESRTLVSTHEDRPNNWGTLAGASRIAADLYLSDTSDLTKAAQVLKGYLGDRTAYKDFVYGELSWQCDPTNPVGINPPNCPKNLNGVSLDIGSALPDDMRRGCAPQSPPCYTDYPWEGLQGIIVQAELLSRQGFDVWNWENQAIKRAVQYLYDLRTVDPQWYIAGDDVYIPWIINHAYKTSFPTVTPARYGKNMGWTDWTHAL